MTNGSDNAESRDPPQRRLAPPSIAHQFRVAKRAVYIWISVGSQASASTRTAVAALLDRIWIARYPAP